MCDSGNIFRPQRAEIDDALNQLVVFERQFPAAERHNGIEKRVFQKDSQQIASDKARGSGNESNIPRHECYRIPPAASTLKRNEEHVQ